MKKTKTIMQYYEYFNLAVNFECKKECSHIHIYTIIIINNILII